jgi:hypothetical protein
MQLRIEPRRVNHPLPLRVLALEQHCAALVVGLVARRRRNRDGVAEKVAKVRPKCEQRFVGCVLGLLEILQPLGCFAP